MARIAIMGAGSMVFSRNIISDILAFEAFKDSTFALMDIDEERLHLAHSMGKSISASRGASATFETHADRRPALDGADYVINTIGVGGFDATRRDLQIPDEYGLKQTIGDTLGIGGIFRTVRSLPVILEMCHEMEQLCPDAHLLNYTNPMATHCLGIQRTTNVKVVGLCHGVRHTRARMIMLAKLAEMNRQEAFEILSDWEPSEEHESKFQKFYTECLKDEGVRTLAAGINHMSAFLLFERDGVDLYPLLYKALETDYVRKLDPVRLELMKRFGCFMTETSGHIAEYLPWFLKNDGEIERMKLRPLCYIGTCERLAETLEEYKQRAAAGKDFIKPDDPVSVEYASRVLNAVETNEPYVFNGNVHNRGGALIQNLPGDCCVEVPCVADAAGIQPTAIGELPPQCAALMRTNINVQDLVVRAITEQNKAHLRHAAMLDPNAAATLTLPQIDKLLDEMLAAHGELIPEYLR